MMPCSVTHQKQPSDRNKFQLAHPSWKKPTNQPKNTPITTKRHGSVQLLKHLTILLDCIYGLSSPSKVQVVLRLQRWSQRTILPLLGRGAGFKGCSDGLFLVPRSVQPSTACASSSPWQYSGYEKQHYIQRQRCLVSVQVSCFMVK